MRITGGKFRGTKLADIGAGDMAAHLRPSSDRLRETLFNILSNDKYGQPYPPESRRVLDLFAGSGALGLEALSRGAAHVSFVDNGVTARGLIRANCDKLHAGGMTKLLRRDATNMGPLSGPPFDLVFLDPPYGQSLGEQAINNALAHGVLAHGALVVWEEERPPLAPAALQMLDSRQIGRASLTIWQNQGL